MPLSEETVGGYLSSDCYSHGIVCSNVVGLANEYGIVATYAYDAWGKIISTSGASSMEESALAANPIRYRGYIYDTETGFYYLQSRYYDPQIRRFTLIKKTNNKHHPLYGGFTVGATIGRPYKHISAEILFSLPICDIMRLTKSLREGGGVL